MITGFNTDIEHDGVVYHVQTEDKGLETPIILSLVYVGGAILASKRSPYDDLVGNGFDTTALAERLQRQHKLICAAISAGRIEELKQLSQHREGATAQPAANGDSPKGAAEQPTSDAGVAAESTAVPPVEDSSQGLSEEVAGEVPQREAAEQAAPEGEKPRPRRRAAREQTAEEKRPAEAVRRAGAAKQGKRQEASQARPQATPEGGDVIPVEVDGALYVNLMEERDYRAGEIVTLRVRVSRGPVDSREAVVDAAVTVKVLGTEFRPLILTSKTDQDGIAIIHAWLPRFTSGRAAILVRAIYDGYTAELRRAVRHL